MTYIDPKPLRSALLINPKSGSGRGNRVAESFRDILCPNETYISQSVDHTTEIVKDLINRNFELVITAGGDGMVHSAIQNLAMSDVALLPLPGGTGNDFVRALNIPLNVRNFDWLEKLRFTRVDLASTDTQYFCAILSSGFDSRVNERANLLKWPKGRQKYNLAMIQELITFDSVPFHIIIDGTEYHRDAMLMAVANSTSYGGGMKICPNARLDDGLLDVLILNQVSKFEFIKVFPKVFKGTHIKHRQVELLRGAEIEIFADATAYADGEYLQPLPVKISVAPKALKLLSPL